MKRIRIALIVMIVGTLVGCAAEQLKRMAADEQGAERALAAATQATASARETLATMPAGTPGYQQAARVVAASDRVEQTARLALDVAKAAVDAASKQDANDPALRQSLALAIGAIPSPWTPVLAALVPAAIPLVVSIVQSVKLGRAHQTVVEVTRQMEGHKAALEAIRGGKT